MRVDPPFEGYRRGAWAGLVLLMLSACATGTGDEAGYTQVSGADAGGDDAAGSGGDGGSGGTAGDSGSGGSGGGSGSGGSGGGSGSGGTGGTGGSGGSGGSGGTSGTGGESGTGGTGGTGGSGGSGGGSGSGGTGGTGGSGGSGGGSGSGGTGGTGGSGGSGGGSGSGGTGGTGGACIHDDKEPNDTEALADDLGGITDCDGTGDTYHGTLEGSGDKDWFTFFADDQFGCSVNPTFGFQSSASALMCAYFSCVSGGNNVNCSSGSSVDTSPGGLSGCCTTTGAMSPSLNCTGTDDSAQVYVLVYAPSNQTCQSYAVAYHY